MKVWTVFAVSVLAVLMACSEGAPASSSSSTNDGSAPISAELFANVAEQQSQENPISRSTASESEGAIAQSFTSIGDKRYSGTVAVTGSFSMRDLRQIRDIDAFEICFWIEGSDAKKIPRPHGDDRDTWFCLRDMGAAQASGGFKIQDEVLDQMKGGDCEIRGEAAIEIKDYARDGDCECDDNDRATLVRVIRVSDNPVLACGLNELDEDAP